jgi:hypothetical protein
MQYNYFIIMAKLIVLGFKFHQEIDYCTEEWINFTTGKIIRINNTSKDFSNQELLSILEQAGLSLQSFDDV